MATSSLGGHCQDLQADAERAAVLLGIVEVGGVPETAEALGIAETTVKTHLRRLYAKTGTSRQAEIVKLVASYANPLVG